MIIKEISIQNFKSFGNNLQTVKFDDTGKLILFYGKNGKGKSSFQESIDYSLFGIVRGKERKRISLKDLPNRINGSLFTKIVFYNNNDDLVSIERGLEPLKLKVELNGNDITSRFKVMDLDQRESLIGMNYEIYKSFISMSLNDFANFINLDPDTKRKLLNRLFSLEELDNYFEITKEIIKNNKRSIENLQLEISRNIKTIGIYENNIKNIQRSNDESSTKDEIKEKILNKKSRFVELQENIKDLSEVINDKNNDLNNRTELLNSKNNNLNKIDYSLDDIKNKIDIYKSGTCPICGNDLKNDLHSLDTLIEIKSNIEKDKSDQILDIFNYKKETKIVWLEKKKLVEQRNNLKQEFAELGYDLKLLKGEYDSYDKNNIAIKELYDNIKKLEESNIQLKETIKKIESDNEKYSNLNEIFSLTGIRKNIIKNIVDPINDYLSNYLDEMDSEYRVVLNDEFDADIYERFINKIHPESLSSGETRKINIAIALSYLEIIRKMRKNNLLFLDEVFANIDSDNIDILLRILKKFSRKYNINIVIVNHSPVDTNLFDRIIKIDKKIFSMIDEQPL